MKGEIEKHSKIQTFGNEVKQVIDRAISERKTPQELKEDISSLCVKCLLPFDEGCEICNGHTVLDDTSTQLRIIFDEES